MLKKLILMLANKILAKNGGATNIDDVCLVRVSKDFQKWISTDGYKIYEERNHRNIVYRFFVSYCVLFQEYDMDVQRGLTEIRRLIDEIPHNMGITRCGIYFEDDFAYLSNPKSINTLKSALKNIINENKLDSLSLNQFINFAF